MLNHITIMGRLTRDPELRKTGSGISVANFSVAVDSDFKPKDGGEKETDFFDCTAWRQTADFVSKYFTKGRMIVVSGKLKSQNWTDDSGSKRKKVFIVADNVYFGDSKRDGDSGGTNSYGGSTAPSYGGGYGGGYDSYAAPQYTQQEFVELTDDDGQLPF